MLAVLSSIPNCDLSNKSASQKNQLQRQRWISPKFFEDLPDKPYCTNDLAHGLVIRPKEQAIKKPYLSFNPPAMVNWLVFDVDRDNAAFAWADGPCLQAPHFAVVNPENGHAHLWYGLRTPVCRTENAHLSPLRYLASVEFTYTKGLCADKGYAGLVSKNPFHPMHKLLVFRPLHQLYGLGELCPEPETPPKKPKFESGLGRNCSLFEAGKEWAHKAIREVRGMRDKEGFTKGLRGLLETLNGQFASPLPESELRAITASVSGYCIKHDKEAERAFKDRQRAKGKRSGEVRREGSLTEQKPWELEGISRPTWYRRKAKGE